MGHVKSGDPKRGCLTTQLRRRRKNLKSQKIFSVSLRLCGEWFRAPFPSTFVTRRRLRPKLSLWLPTPESEPVCSFLGAFAGASPGEGRKQCLRKSAASKFLESSQNRIRDASTKLMIRSLARRSR